MKKAIKFSFLVVLGFVLEAPTGEAKPHRHHHAHVHGEADVSISFENLNGLIQLRVPTESLWGFEHEAKKSADKKKIKTTTEKLKKNLPQMIAFDERLKCKFSDLQFETKKQAEDSKHLEGELSAKVLCEKSPVGSIIDIQFDGFFQELQKINLTVLADAFQKSTSMEKLNFSFTLK